ncbi:nitrite reductase small subunit NirD [Dietzia timorensis]|uniref:Nitrite reductase [NAD(P)H] small subunit n=1 Tax=Dietzia timorensis TaxID=499555 RepID=A0A173LR31_9ACTN|nr:nitrite reductase small subunit NirD [Dietzia timorensis]ANI93372.1 Nitrite reductase [NAD(P)H] small subunit [Dietzia timorensis]
MTVIETTGLRAGAEVAVCTADALEANLGECVLLPDGRQVALFKVFDPKMDIERVYAVSNIDPYMNAAVMSRGIVGEHDGVPTVASPLLKQVFRLDDGRSLDDDSLGLEVFRAEIRDGEVIIAY